MKINDPPVEFLAWSRGFPDGFDEVFDLVYLLMDAVFMPSFRVEEDFLFNMVPVYKDVFVFVSLRVE